MRCATRHYAADRRSARIRKNYPEANIGLQLGRTFSAAQSKEEGMSDPSAPRVVVTPCHGVVVNPALAREEAAWIGIFPGESELLVEHVRLATKLAVALSAYWVPTGGATRIGTTLSEAESAVNLARAEGWLGESGPRTIIENHARDSLGNLALASAEVRRNTGQYPCEMTVVGYRFKRHRFEAHARDLGFTCRFHYIGVNDPRADILPDSLMGEYLKSRDLREDPLLRGSKWRAQRNARNPYAQVLPDYAAVDPVLGAFLEYVFEGGPPAPPPNW